MRSTLSFLLTGLMAVCFACPAEAAQKDAGPKSDKPGAEESRAEAPAFALPDLKGRKFESSDLKGSVVVLDFWATWCGPCLAEIPAFNRLYKKYASRGIKLIGIAVQSGWAKDIKPHVAKHKISYTILTGNDDLVEKYQVMGFPTTYLIGKDWKIYKKYYGTSPDKEAEMEQDIERLLAAP